MEPLYTILTCFERNELSDIISDAERWPGVPSEVQPPLEHLLRRVTGGIGKLPPLPNRPQQQQPAEQARMATGGRVQAVSGVVPGVMAREAKIAAAPIRAVAADVGQQRAATSVRVDTRGSVTKVQAKPLQSAGVGKNRSVIDVLRALRS